MRSAATRRIVLGALCAAALSGCGGGVDDADPDGAAPSASAAALPELEAAPADTDAPGSPARPSITAQPKAVEVAAGQTATFRVRASGSGLKYQWRRDGRAIRGATGARYTTAAVDRGDDGARYSVVVSNRAGRVTSRAAVLRVRPAAVTGAMCYDLDPRKGKTIEYTYLFEAYDLAGKVTSSGPTTQTTVVGDRVQFAGHEALEVRATGFEVFSNGQRVDFTGAEYWRRTGALEFTEYGETAEMDGAWSRIVYDPPLVDRSPAMKPGDRASATTTLVFESSTGSGWRSTQTDHYEFVGIERLAIAAGKFDACRFEHYADPQGPRSVRWLLVGHGLELKYVEPPDSITGGYQREVTALRIAD